MNPVEIEIKDTTESNTFASYLDLILFIGKDGHLHTSIDEKRGEFRLSRNIPLWPAYMDNVPIDTTIQSLLY